MLTKFLLQIGVLIIVILSPGWLLAQSKCSCCTESHEQFDFWVGKWTVADTLGNKVGDNLIAKRDGNCVLLEQWTGTKGSTGTSINFWDKTDATWNQLWVDNNGGVLKLKGRFESGSMVMRSEPIQGTNGNPYYNQIKWTPNQDGSVTQLWEALDQHGNTLQVIFKGIYNRVQEGQDKDD